MEIKEIPVPTMPDWLKLYNTYDPEYYAPGKRVSAEEWNALFLASVRQGNYNADTLELLIKTYLPETYLTQTDFNTFSNEMRAEYTGFTTNIQESFIEHKKQVQDQYDDLAEQVQNQYDTFTGQVQNQYDTFIEQVQEDFASVINEVNSLEERVIKAEDVAYSLDDTIQEANQYAKQAFTIAESANSAAQEAAISAENAESSASNAQHISEEANSFAQTALTTSQNASTVANEAKAQSAHATDTANAALLRSEDAIATANAAKIESASAKTTAEQAEEVSTASNSIAQTANATASEARRIAQNALDQITEGVGSQVLVNGESVSTFNADTKADLDYVDRQIAALIGAAPETLNTLEEVAKAIEENETVVDALNSAIGTKANKEDIKDLETLRTLPYEYQEVEYIESTGTQYIDTGVVPSNKTQVDIEFEISSTSEADAALFGARDGVGSSSSFVIWANNHGGNTNSTFAYSTYSSRKNLLLDTKYACKYSWAGMFVNGEQIGNPPSSDITFTCQSVALLLGVRTGTTLDNRRFIGKVYSAKIFDNVTLLRHFIPCYRKSDGEIGLYDLVNNVFYVNQGTGTLLKGKNVYLSNVARRNDVAIKFAKSEYEKTKNLFDLSRVSMTQYSGAIPEIDVANGTITLKRFYNASLNTLKDFADLEVGETYTLSLVASENQHIYLVGSSFRWDNGKSHTITQAELDGTVAFYGMTDGSAQTVSNIQIEPGLIITEYHSYNGPVLHKADLNDRVAFTKYASISVAGTTKDVYKYDPTTIYAPNGLIMGGTALAAGLVTRGICGVNTPNESGYCTKDNLYINYDGSNTYSSARQLILQAENSGTHYGNNLYQYAAARGDAVKGYCDANYLSLNSGGKLKGKLSFDGDNSITPLQAISYIVGLQPFASGGNLVYMNADKFKNQTRSSIIPGGLNYFTTGYIKSAAPASGITTSISSNILTVTATEGNNNYVSIGIDHDIEANMAEGEQFIFSMDIRATTDTAIAVSGKPKIYFKEGMGYYDMEGEVKRLSSGQYTTLTYVGNWKKTKSDGTAINPAFHLGFGSTVGKFYITNLRFEKGSVRTESARLLHVDSTKIMTDKSLEIKHSTEPRVFLTAANSGSDIRVEFKCESSSTNSFIGIGSGGVNNGYYSRTLNKWLWYADASKWYLNQPTINSGIISSALQLPQGAKITDANGTTILTRFTDGQNYLGTTDIVLNLRGSTVKVTNKLECSEINLLV